LILDRNLPSLKTISRKKEIENKRKLLKDYLKRHWRQFLNDSAKNGDNVISQTTNAAQSRVLGLIYFQFSHRNSSFLLLVSCFHYFPYVNGLGSSQVTSKLFVSFFYVFIGTYAFLIFWFFPQKHRINTSLQIEIRD
jgi:hypothetical protein